ncbi:hypothetical protein ACFCV8_13860 [Streptomyces sp. NPDC056347]|uniref:hypothetical protein n=1 Tax=Streptomyces sp. NPDC056347 TaxID=3345790 RepID=UPI0035E20FFA
MAEAGAEAEVGSGTAKLPTKEVGRRFRADSFMRGRLRLPRPVLAVCGTALSVALMSGCTGEDVAPKGATASERAAEQSRKPSAKASGPTEKKLGEQVQQTLGTKEPGESGPLFVESGLERAGDGFHTEPELERGRSYGIEVACAGTGQVVLSVTGVDRARRRIDCDGAPVHQRFTAPTTTAVIRAEAVPGVTGMVGWRLDKAAE